MRLYEQLVDAGGAPPTPAQMTVRLGVAAFTDTHWRWFRYAEQRTATCAAWKGVKFVGEVQRELGLPFRSKGQYPCELLACAEPVGDAVQGRTYIQETFAEREELETHYETVHADLGGVEGVRAELRRRVARGQMPRVITAQTQRRLAEGLWRNDLERVRPAFCALCGCKSLMPAFTGEGRDGALHTTWSCALGGRKYAWVVPKQCTVSLIPEPAPEAQRLGRAPGQERMVQLLGLPQYRHCFPQITDCDVRHLGLGDPRGRGCCPEPSEDHRNPRRPGGFLLGWCRPLTGEDVVGAPEPWTGQRERGERAAQEVVANLAPRLFVTRPNAYPDNVEASRWYELWRRRNDPRAQHPLPRDARAARTMQMLGGGGANAGLAR